MRLFILAGLIGLASGCSTMNSEVIAPSAMPTEAQALAVTTKFTANGKTINLEVADSPSELQTGLMFRPSLPADRGMLFEISPATTVQFWMQNVKFPLDMVFLRGGEIIAIAENTKPCDTEKCPLFGPPEERVDQVIELNGGTARTLRLKVGDRIEFQTIPSP